MRVAAVCACVFCAAKLSLEEVRRIYHRMKVPVFEKHWTSTATCTEAFTKLLKDTFGSITMGEVKSPR